MSLGERHGPRVVRIRGVRRTGGHAAAALDAIRELQVLLEIVRALEVLARGLEHLGRVFADEVGVERLVRVEHGPEVRHQIPDDREVRQRRDGDECRAEFGHLGIAGKREAGVDEHAARSAHTHPAGRSPGQGRSQDFLDRTQAVQHRHARRVRNRVVLPGRLELRDRVETANPERDVGWCCHSHSSTRLQGSCQCARRPCGPRAGNEQREAAGGQDDVQPLPRAGAESQFAQDVPQAIEPVEECRPEQHDVADA